MSKQSLEDIKIKIQENINCAKNTNINKVSAILMLKEENMKKELLTWLILEGYKVSLKKDEIDILVIEW